MITKRIYTEGHRGLCAYYPENTLPSYEKAMEAGVDAIDFQMAEFDGYDAYDEIGLAMNLVRSELLELYASKGLPSKRKRTLHKARSLVAPQTKFDQIQQDTILDIVHIANAIYCLARRCNIRKHGTTRKKQINPRAAN